MRIRSILIMLTILTVPCLGLAQTDARTDIYAIGVLYNVMLTGQHPSVTMASGKAGRIVRKCTAVNPNERFQTATELWTAL